MKVYYEDTFIEGADITNLFKDVYTRTTETDCDYFIVTSIDSKLVQKKEQLKDFISKAKVFNKKIIFLGQGDVEEGYLPSSLGYNFKNNLYKTLKHKNEFSLTPLSDERVPNREFKLHDGRCSIGFVGADNRFNRATYLHELKQSDIPTQFIIKNGPYWGTDAGIEHISSSHIREIQQRAEIEYYKNMEENLLNCLVS